MTRRFAWLTDVHLNFLPAHEVDRFLAEVAALAPDAVLLGGDVAEGHDVVEYLERMDDAWGCPLYFVLGNHDFYHSSIAAVRRAVRECTARRPGVHYLTSLGVVELTPDLALVGHDGWADARLGNYEQSLVLMNDHRLIEDFAGLTKQDRWPVLQRLGDAAAEHLGRCLAAALDSYPEALLLTHVPPWREACWHQGRLSDDQWLPHFTCRAAGEAIEREMRRRPERRLTVLCGHTHGRGEADVLPNLKVLTGGAEYGAPAVERILAYP